ncbi:YdgH/BhsA/McbA-like domain containing protein [Enterobacter hormaechei]
MGRYNSIGDAVAAASKAANKNGTASFYVVDQSNQGNSDNQRVTMRCTRECPKSR